MNVLYAAFLFCPSIYIMNHPRPIVSNKMEEFITLYLIERLLNTFANRADPDQATLVRAA